MIADAAKYTLQFIRPGGTSRGTLTRKETYILQVSDGSRWGIGECALFRGLSADDRPGYEAKLQWACAHIGQGPEALAAELVSWPSLVFGLEQAFRSLASPHPMQLFDSDFLRGKPLAINGLIWMGDRPFMEQQIREKLQEGYRCLKLKIGALEFQTELGLLRDLRERFPAGLLEIRVDANGAFSPAEAPYRLEALAKLDIHSIEQPIAAGQPEAMAHLCATSPVPIALDEELIGIFDSGKRGELLEKIRPSYIILKPSLAGGIAAGQDWIGHAEARGIGWWVTSALESNIGLNAIAQWTATLRPDLPQGLGTGALFSNNFESPLRTAGGNLVYDAEKSWNIPLLKTLCI